MRRTIFAISCAAAVTSAQISIGSQIPNVGLDLGFPPEKVMMGDFCKGKKVVVVGVPGAFTPTWSNKHVPGYLEKQDALKAAGISDVIIYGVNDGAVMTGWAKDQGTTGSMLKMVGDPTSEFTKALGLVFDDPKAMAVLGNPRCKRFSMYVDDGVIKTLRVAEGDVPAEDTFVDKMLEDIKGTAAAAALQYPAAAPPLFKTSASAFAAQPTRISLGSTTASLSKGLSQPLASHPPLPSQRFGAAQSLPGSLPNRAPAPQRFAGPRLDEESDDPSLFDVLIAGMIGFIVGSGVTFALFPRPIPTTQKPLLAA